MQRWSAGISRTRLPPASPPRAAAPWLPTLADASGLTLRARISAASAFMMHSSYRRQLLHFATDLAALVENPSDLPHGFDLLNRSYATPAAEDARAALLHHPAIAPLVKERYWGTWPKAQELGALPPMTPGCSSGCATPTTSGTW